MYYNKGKWINEHEYEKERYYNEYYDDGLDLVTTDKNSCICESEADSHNDSVLHEMFFAIEKKILISLEKISTFVNAFTVCKFCNNPIKIEDDNNKLVGLGCFLKTVGSSRV